MEEILGASDASASDAEAASLEVGAAPKSSDAIAPMRMEVQSDNEDSTDSDDEDSLSQPHEMPNVLILHVGQLSPNAKTPHLKLLMQQGVCFSNCYGSSTGSALSCFAALTGQLPSSIGCYDNAASLSPAVPTVAHLMSSRGYEASLCGPIALSELHGFVELSSRGCCLEDPGGTGTTTAEAGHAPSCAASDAAEEAGFACKQKLRRVARGHQQAPFFVWCSLVNPHLEASRCGPTEFYELYDEEEEAKRVAYAMQSCIDRQVGEVVETLRREGLTDRVLVVVVGDPGGEGQDARSGPSHAEGHLKMPLCFCGPPGLRARCGLDLSPRVVGHVVSGSDIFSTLVSLTSQGGVPEWAQHDVQGESLLPLLQVGARPDATPARGVYCEAPWQGLYVVRQGHHKLVYRATSEAPWLFDIEQDPQEEHDIATAPEHAQKLTELLAMAKACWPDVDALEYAMVAAHRARRLIAAAQGFAVQAGAR